MNQKKSYVILVVFTVFQIVGMLGLLFNYQVESILALTPLNLSILTVMLLLYQPHKNKKYWIWVIGSMLYGILVEIAGVHVSWVFGEYFYGSSLGISVLSVPLTMGLNWFIMLSITYTLIGKLNLSPLLSSLIGALFMVIIDVLIEAVAPKLDYWYFPNNVAPISNFLWWFGLSLAPLFIAFKWLKLNNKGALPVFLSMVVFFAVVLFRYV